MTTIRIAAAAALAVVAASLQTAGAAPLRCPQTSGGVPIMTWTEQIRTGNDASGRIPYTNQDFDWWVVPGDLPTYSVSPHSAWTAPIAADANWINSKTTYASNGTTGGVENYLPEEAASLVPAVPTPVSTTTTRFRTYFTVPDYAFLAELNLDYAADNGVTFFLNGAPIGGYDPPVADPSAFQQLRQVVWAGQFLPGVNTLDAVVTDHGVATGLYVDGTARACVPAIDFKPGICVEVRRDGLGLITYSPMPIDLGTGETGHVPHAFTTADDDWDTVAPAAGDAYSVAPHQSWITSPIANWINATPTRVSASPPATRTYAVDFTVPAGYTYADLDLRFAADNTVRFYLNGLAATNLIGGYTVPNQTAFNQWHTLLHIGQHFTAGTNTLYAVVTDDGASTGLIVEGGARVCPRRFVG